MYKHPGVYIEELPSGVIPIEAASTSVAAFIGPVRRGKINVPRFITGVTQYEKDFGEMNDTAGGIRDFGDDPDYFGHAVHAFFGNGGKKAYIVRVATTKGANKAETAEAAIFDPLKPMERAFYFETKSEGNWGNRLVVILSEVAAGESSLGYTLQVGTIEGGEFEALETFSDLFLKEQSGTYLVSVVNDQSALVSVERKPIPSTVPGGGGETVALLSGSLKNVDFTSLEGLTLTVNVDGAPIGVVFNDSVTDIHSAASFIEGAVGSGFQAQVTKDNQLLLISGSRDADSEITVTAGGAGTTLKFDPPDSTEIPYPNGGEMTALRSGSLAGVGFRPLDGKKLIVKVDNLTPAVDVVFTPAETTVELAAAFIQQVVRNGATTVGRAGFQALVTEDQSLFLVSGSSDSSAKVQITQTGSTAAEHLELKLINLVTPALPPISKAGDRGALRGGTVTVADIASLSGKKFTVVVDNFTPGVDIEFMSVPTDLKDAADMIQTQVRGAANPPDGRAEFQALVTLDDSLLLVSGSSGSNSSVTLVDGDSPNEALQLLKLRPVDSNPTTLPDSGPRKPIQGGSLAGIGFRSLDTKKLMVKVDDLPVVEITFGATQTTVEDVRDFIQTAVHDAEAPLGEDPGRANFEALVTDDGSLLLVSGSRGPDTKVTLDPVIGPAVSAEEFLNFTTGTGLEEVFYPPGGTSRFMGGEDGDDNLNVNNYNKAFDNLKDYRDVSIILLPGVSYDKDKAEKLIIDAAIAHSEKMKNRVVVVDPPEKSEFISPKSVSVAKLTTSSHAALYYPWLKVPNPHFHPEIAANLPSTFKVGASAFAAGIWARIDGTRGVWKAPAGLEASVRGSLGPSKVIGDDIQDNLNDLGINCIRSIIGPPVVWGARMLSTKVQPDFRYVPIRRTSAMIGESLYNALQAVVFEPNKHILWSALRSNIGNFMDGLFRAGAFQGEKASDAYFVRCNLGDTMTQTDVNAGIVRVIVGYAALKPAEFVIIQLKQKVGQSTS